MADIIVKYNDTTISPTPLVHQNYQFIDYGTRWGNVQEIELNGYVTGVTVPVTSIQSGFAGIFTGQFGILEVLDGASTLYKWSGVIVDDITFPLNRLFPSTSTVVSMVPYSVKMRAINVPSGVLDPVNEYAFTQGDDSIVTVVHKVSARGIRNQLGGLQNAINFVNSFTGVAPFDNVLSAAFSPTGSGVLLNFVENIDRASCTYSVQEIYKYNTGLVAPYVESWTVSSSDMMDNEWFNIDFDWKIQGSTIKKNLNDILVGGYLVSPLNKMVVLGYNTGNFIQSNYSIVRDTGACLIQIKASYVSGYSAADTLGYLDYTVSLSNDMVLTKEDWRLDGDFVCRGPIEHRRARLADFKTNSGAGNWRTFASGLIVASPVYAYHSGNHTFGGHIDIEINENTGLAQFHLSATTTDGSHPDNFLYPKYTLDIQPNKWIYDLMPSANIEGHYVLQDLQMMAQGHLTFTVDGQSKRIDLGLPIMSGYLNSLSQVYVNSGFIVAEGYNTGLLDMSCNREYLAQDKMSSGLLYTKMAGTTLTDYLRVPGYKFGY